MANPQPTQQTPNQTTGREKQAYGQQGKPGFEQPTDQANKEQKAEWKSGSSCSSDKDASACSTDKDQASKKSMNN